MCGDKWRLNWRHGTAAVETTCHREGSLWSRTYSTLQQRDEEFISIDTAARAFANSANILVWDCNFDNATQR